MAHRSWRGNTTAAPGSTPFSAIPPRDCRDDGGVRFPRMEMVRLVDSPACRVKLSELEPGFKGRLDVKRALLDAREGLGIDRELVVHVAVFAPRKWLVGGDADDGVGEAADSTQGPDIPDTENATPPWASTASMSSQSPSPSQAQAHAQATALDAPNASSSFTPASQVSAISTTLGPPPPKPRNQPPKRMGSGWVVMLTPRAARDLIQRGPVRTRFGSFVVDEPGPRSLPKPLPLAASEMLMHRFLGAAAWCSGLDCVLLDDDARVVRCDAHVKVLTAPMGEDGKPFTVHGSFLVKWSEKHPCSVCDGRGEERVDANANANANDDGAPFVCPNLIKRAVTLAKADALSRLGFRVDVRARPMRAVEVVEFPRVGEASPPPPPPPPPPPTEQRRDVQVGVDNNMDADPVDLGQVPL